MKYIDILNRLSRTEAFKKMTNNKNSSQFSLSDERIVEDGEYLIKLVSLTWNWSPKKMRQILTSTFIVCDNDQYGGYHVKTFMDLDQVEGKGAEWAQKNLVSLMRALNIKKLGITRHKNNFVEVDEDDLKNALFKRCKAKIGMKEYVDKDFNTRNFQTVEFIHVSSSSENVNYNPHFSKSGFDPRNSRNREEPSKNSFDDDIPF